MSTNEEINERIQKYGPVEIFRILDQNGKALNTIIKKEDDKGNQTEFSNNYSDIPKLLNKSVSVVRDLDPLVKYNNIE
jgi:hypothetical protein